jgi:hypothetical protein
VPGWVSELSEAKLEELRHNPSFAEVLTLGRASNLIRAVMAAGLAEAKGDTPAASRQRTSMIFLQAGLVSEALLALERCGEHLRHLPAHESEVRPILRDPVVASLRREFLSPLRNQAVFHNDQVVSREGLLDFRPGGVQPLVAGDSDRLIDVYHSLADVVGVNYLLRSRPADDDPGPWLKQSLNQTRELGTRICIAIDKLVGEAFSSWGIEWRDLA